MKLQLRRKPFIRVAWICVSDARKANFELFRSDSTVLCRACKVNGNLIFISPPSPCTHENIRAEQIRRLGDQKLRDVLKTLGGWPVIEPNWKPPSVSIEYLMGTLRGEYSEPVLIELYVGADDKNSSINILQVSARKNCADRKKSDVFIMNFPLAVRPAGAGAAFERLLSQAEQRGRPESISPLHDPIGCAFGRKR